MTIKNISRRPLSSYFLKVGGMLNDRLFDLGGSGGLHGLRLFLSVLLGLGDALAGDRRGWGSRTTPFSMPLCSEALISHDPGGEKHLSLGPTPPPIRPASAPHPGARGTEVI